MKADKRKTVWISVATLLAAQLVWAGTSSSPMVVDATSRNRRWMTVFSSEVPLRWEWVAGATQATLEIVGMNSSSATTFNEETTTFDWTVFTSTTPALEDVYSLNLTFKDANANIVGGMTSRVAVVKGAFGAVSVDAVATSTAWTQLKGNVVLPYDNRWDPIAATNAATTALAISRADEAVSSDETLAGLDGYYGWKVTPSNWGYGLFNLELSHPEADVSWDAMLTRYPQGAVVTIR